jgi:hypothetical protein
LTRAGDHKVVHGLLNVAELKQPVAKVLRYGPVSALIDLLKSVKFGGSKKFIKGVPLIQYAPRIASFQRATLPPSNQIQFSVRG